MRQSSGCTVILKARFVCFLKTVCSFLYSGDVLETSNLSPLSQMLEIQVHTTVPRFHKFLTTRHYSVHLRLSERK